MSAFYFTIKLLVSTCDSLYDSLFHHQATSLYQAVTAVIQAASLYLVHDALSLILN